MFFVYLLEITASRCVFIGAPFVWAANSDSAGCQHWVALYALSGGKYVMIPLEAPGSRDDRYVCATQGLIIFDA